MKFIKKVLPIALLAPLVLGGNFATAADVPDEQFVSGAIPISGDRASQYGVFFEENVDTLRMPSLLAGFNLKEFSQNNFMQNIFTFCSSLDDAACKEATNFKYYALLPPCASESDTNCIESVFAITPQSPAKIFAAYKRTMPSRIARSYQADVSRGLPQGGNAGIWEMPDLNHQGGTNQYAVLMSVVGNIPSNPSSATPLPDFRASILPVNIITDPGYKANVAFIADGAKGAKAVSISHPGSKNFEPCAIVEDGACALRQGFPENIKFGMSVRLSSAVNGWLHGRIGNPLIDYQVTSRGTRIEVSGLPTKVPVVAGYVQYDKLSEEEKVSIKGGGGPGGVTMPGTSGQDAMNALNGWAKLLGNKASAYPSQWTFYNLPDYQMQDSDQCIRNSKTLAGFVTTNSTTYAAGPPVFNPDSQSLDYKVASAHYLKDGSTFLGEYILYIDSKVARCIYKFSSAPISATISIVSDSGEAKVATTTMSESGGWIHLVAAGFSFSSPTIRVKLTQEIATSPSPSMTPGPTVAKRLIITCIRGKTSKKVSGVNPACPSGWKKK